MKYSLETAAEQASGVIGNLKDKKADAALVTAAYEVAGIDREGDIESKLSALSGLYGAYISGRLLAYLGGFQTTGLS